MLILKDLNNTGSLECINYKYSTKGLRTTCIYRTKRKLLNTYTEERVFYTSNSIVTSSYLKASYVGLMEKDKNYVCPVAGQE